MAPTHGPHAPLREADVERLRVSGQQHAATALLEHASKLVQQCRIELVVVEQRADALAERKIGHDAVDRVAGERQRACVELHDDVRAESLVAHKDLVAASVCAIHERQQVRQLAEVGARLAHRHGGVVTAHDQVGKACHELDRHHTAANHRLEHHGIRPTRRTWRLLLWHILLYLTSTTTTTRDLLLFGSIFGVGHSGCIILLELELEPIIKIRCCCCVVVIVVCRYCRCRRGGFGGAVEAPRIVYVKQPTHGKRHRGLERRDAELERMLARVRRSPCGLGGAFRSTATRLAVGGLDGIAAPESIGHQVDREPDALQMHGELELELKGAQLRSPVREALHDGLGHGAPGVLAYDVARHARDLARHTEQQRLLEQRRPRCIIVLVESVRRRRSSSTWWLGRCRERGSSGA